MNDVNKLLLQNHAALEIIVKKSKWINATFARLTDMNDVIIKLLSGRLLHE
jgi:hypothetical protein